MQIFSRQAAMMDALISHFADQTRRRKDGTDVVDNVADDGEFYCLLHKNTLLGCLREHYFMLIASDFNAKMRWKNIFYELLFLFPRTKSNSEQWIGCAE